MPVARLLLAKGAQTGAGSVGGATKSALCASTVVTKRYTHVFQGSITPLIAAVQSGSAQLLRLMLSQEGVTPNDAAVRLG